jgi:hypothetical protein
MFKSFSKVILVGLWMLICDRIQAQIAFSSFLGRTAISRFNQECSIVSSIWASMEGSVQMSPYNCCSWNGIVCENNRVTELYVVFKL